MQTFIFFLFFFYWFIAASLILVLFMKLMKDFVIIKLIIGLPPSSDSAAMASGTPDVTTNQEPAEVQEECSGNSLIKCFL